MLGFPKNNLILWETYKNVQQDVSGQIIFCLQTILSIIYWIVHMVVVWIFGLWHYLHKGHECLKVGNEWSALKVQQLLSSHSILIMQINIVKLTMEEGRFVVLN